MKLINLLSFATIIAFSLVFTSCDKDDPIIPNEEELITTVRYTLTPDPPIDANEVVLSFTDIDGDGDLAPTITGGSLLANTTYSGSLQLLNEAESPAEDITEEIEEEDDEHQFFFETTVSGLSVAYADQDDDGNPIGLATTIATGGAATGTLTVTLLHEPVKDAEGVSGGNSANAQGEIDVEVTFPVTVQ